MNLVCINCPKGCELNVEYENSEYIVSGNSCLRGREYGISEMKEPLRNVATTIAIESNYYDRLPVMTSAPIPKRRVMDIVRVLKDVKVKAPIKINQVIIENIYGLGADIIASKTIRK